jgi:DNA-binding transcriptional LysR family regulator
VIDPENMLLFALLLQEGSFTAAARSLGITKQSVSERISKLER